ncbi:hypothetical protein NQZ79_g8467 [Umbelopsis isabellina]|nr:hypothetical protein NQZ79_g8467 [Umbelopsis isabellina]
MDRERAGFQLNATNEVSNDEKHEQVDVSGTKNTQIKPGPIAVPKIAEARVALVVTKNSELFSRNDPTQWLLRHMFQPLVVNEYDSVDVLYLSSSRRPMWQTPRQQSAPPPASAQTPTINNFWQNPITPSPAQTSPLVRSPTPTSTGETGALARPQAKVFKKYLVTPQTNVLSISREYRYVFMIDLSSSLATVDGWTGRLLIEDAFETLSRCLAGVIKPYGFDNPTRSLGALIEPVIHVTVLAECSQFASNLNVIPILEEYPTLRVLLQSVIVTPHNSPQVLEKLKEGLKTFQNDLIAFRKSLSKRREKMGYELDVRGEREEEQDIAGGNEYDPATNVNTTSEPQISSPERKRTLKGRRARSSSRISLRGIGTKTALKAGVKHNRSVSVNNQRVPPSPLVMEHAKHQIQPKQQAQEVWGVGKTGGNLSYLLHAGLFALGLLPQSARPGFVLITDGVIKSNVQDEAIIRQMRREDVNCSVIQVGAQHGFSPGCNFGLVADNEILRFLASATLGHFMYSEQCHETEQAETAASDAQLDQTGAETQIRPPNIYHRMFLIRDICFGRARTESQIIPLEEGVDSQTNLNFPWDPRSISPPVENHLLKYQEYPLPSDFSHVIAARVRQGFVVQSLNVEDHTTRSGEYSLRKERIQIVLLLQWQPNITVEYRIRASWFPAYIAQVETAGLTGPGGLGVLHGGIFARSKAPKAEIFIRAYAVFAHTLQNWDALHRRAQMMGLVTGGDSFGEYSASPLYSKVYKLKKFLLEIYRVDEVLKSFIGYNARYLSGSKPVSDEEVEISLSRKEQNQRRYDSYVAALKEFWNHANGLDVRSLMFSCYDVACIDILISNLKPYSSLKLTMSYEDYIDHFEHNIQHTISRIKDYVDKQWATLTSDDEDVYVKVLQKSRKNPFQAGDDHLELESYDWNREQGENLSLHNLQQVISFVELRLRRENGNSLSARLMFFNADVYARRRIVRDLKEGLNQIRYDNETWRSLSNRSEEPDPLYWQPDGRYLKVLQRPLSNLLMRDPAHLNSADRVPQYLTKFSPLYSQRQVAHKPWFISRPTWLTSEYIVPNYLRHITCRWQIDQVNALANKENSSWRILELAFQFICQNRLEQNFDMISSQNDSAHFYCEDKRYIGPETLSAQFFVSKDVHTGSITTEMWIEPTHQMEIDDHEFLSRSFVFASDKALLSRLVTFDKAHAIGRARTREQIQLEPVRKPHESEAGSYTDISLSVSDLFDMTTVLQHSSFLVASFACPTFNNNTVNESDVVLTGSGSATPDVLLSPKLGSNGNDTHKPLTASRSARPVQKTSPSASPKLDTQSGGLHPHPLSSGSSTEPMARQNELHENYKQALFDLSPNKQDYALLHYFVEQALSRITDGEVVMAGQHSSDSFWKNLTQAMLATDEQSIRNSALQHISDIRQLRCFIKIFDPKSFIVIIFPMLNATIRGMKARRRASRQYSPADTTTGGFLTLLEDMPIGGGAEAWDIQSLGVIMFECRRLKALDEGFVSRANGYSNKELSDNVLSGPISIRRLPHLIEENDGLGATLRPEMFEGSFQQTKSNVGLSERTLRLTQDIVKVYERNFVKSIYVCLLQGKSVEPNDFSKLLEICDESSMDIDVTGYVNVQTLRRNNHHINMDEMDDVHQRFLTILGHYFEPVNTTNGSRPSMYCYRPPFARFGYRNSSNDEKIRNLLDLSAYFQNPLLIRLECTFSKASAEGKDKVDVTVPITHLPSSYDVKTGDGKVYTLQPDGIGNEQSPVASTDGTTATLHIICLTLPWMQEDRDDHDWNYVSDYNADGPITPQPSLVDAMRSKPTCFDSLSRDKQEALAETEARLLWLLTEEIMHGLLRSGPVNQPVLDYIESQLKKKNPFVDFPTSMLVPLTFVKRPRLGRRIFLDQLAKDRHSPYPLSRVGDYFYVNEDIKPSDMKDFMITEPTTPITPLTDSDLTTQGLMIRGIDQDQVDAEENGGDEFCQGLGISIIAPTEQSGLDDEPSEAYQVSHRQLYWLLLIPQPHSVQIYFYSKSFQSVNRSEIIKHTKIKISEVLERTNRLILLHDLEETKLCSKFLMAPDENESQWHYSSDEMVEDEDGHTDAPRDLADILTTNEVSELPSKKFRPGQFECPMVFFKQFPLHWRLQPKSALNILANDVLRPFAVKNRSNMFVIPILPKNDSIVYCKLSEVVVTISVPEVDLAPEENPRKTSSPFGSSLTKPADPMASPKSSPHYKLQTNSQQHSQASSPKESGGSNGQSPQHSPKFGGNLSPGYHKGAQRTMESRELLLEVYGIEASSWIEGELVDMLENRLSSQITLKEVQQFLTRNPNSRLSPADIDFILPVDKPVTCKKTLRVPTLIEDPYCFMQFIKQNVLASSLRSLTGPEVVHATKRHLRSMFGFNYTEYNSNSGNRQASPSDTCFYYSCLNRSLATASALEMKVGQGIAGVCFILLDKSGYPCLEIPASIEPTMAYKKLDSLAVEECLNDDFMEREDKPNHYQIMIEIWHVGQVDPEPLMKHLWQCYRQSICEYLIETILISDRSSLMTYISANNATPHDEYRRRSSASSAMHSHLLDPLFTILKKAGAWETQAVSEMCKPIDIPPWGLRDVIRQIQADLMEVDKSCKPIVARADTMVGFHQWPNFQILNPEEMDFIQDSAEVNQNGYYIILSGHREFQRYFESLDGRSNNSSKADSSRSFGKSSTPEHKGGLSDKHVRKSSNFGPKSKNSKQRLQAEAKSMAGVSKSSSDGIVRYKTTLNETHERHHFFLMSIDSEHIATYTYNWTDAYIDKIFGRVYRSIHRQQHRSTVLNNIVHQKMGLFHHAKSIPDAMQQLSSGANYKTTTQATPPAISTSSSRPGFSSLLQGPFKPLHSPGPSGPSSSQRLPLVDTSSRVAIPSLASPSAVVTSQTITPTVTFNLLQELVMYPVQSKSSGSLQRPQLISDHRTIGSFNAQDDKGSRKTEDLFYTAARNAAINDVLKDSTTEPSIDQPYSEHADLLIRHGSPFLNSYLRRTSLQTAHEKAFSVYTKWAKKYQDPRFTRDETQRERMPYRELSTILRSSRLLHFCRTPLLFSEIGVSEQKAESRIFTDPRISASSVDSTLLWYSNLVTTFMREYAAYLESIGMQIIVFGPSPNEDISDSEAYISKFKIADDLSVECPVVYLLKVFEGGTIMCEVRITDMFVSVTLYTLHRRYGRMTYTPWTYEKDEARRFSFRTFTEECDNFKQLIHVNSFVYDFHLRYITRALGKSGLVPLSLNLVHVIRHFASLHTHSAAYSRNRIVTGLYECDGDSSVMDNLFGTISRNAERYGLQALYLGSKVSACFLQSDSLTFEKINSTEKKNRPYYRYTLLLCPPTESFYMAPSFDGMTPASSTRLTTNTTGESSDRVILQYYIIASYSKATYSQERASKFWGHVGNSSPLNPMDEIMAPETYALGDVIQNAKKKIDSLIAQAISFTGRDYDWNRMFFGALRNSRVATQIQVQTPDTSAEPQQEVTAEEVVKLVNRFEKQNVLEVDPNFGKYFQPCFNWPHMLGFLHNFYPISGEISVNGDYHLFLFHPQATYDYVMHFKLAKEITIEMVYREKSTDKTLGEMEKQLIADVAKSIGYYMIQHVKSSRRIIA